MDYSTVQSYFDIKGWARGFPRIRIGVSSWAWECELAWPCQSRWRHCPWDVWSQTTASLQVVPEMCGLRQRFPYKRNCSAIRMSPGPLGSGTLSLVCSCDRMEPEKGMSVPRIVSLACSPQFDSCAWEVEMGRTLWVPGQQGLQWVVTENSKSSVCLCLQSEGIKGLYHCYLARVGFLTSKDLVFEWVLISLII